MTITPSGSGGSGTAATAADEPGSGAPGGGSATGARRGRPALPLLGAGKGGRPSSPFRPAAPSIALALAYTAATLTWLALGDALPGGRWLAVHLFTLGVVTNLVLTFSEHFSRTLTRAPGERAPWWPLVTNAGILGVLVGLPAGAPWLVAVGATVVTVAVFAAYRRIRRMRRDALGARFGWVVRSYERAHGQFIHAAVLGALLGAGMLPGAWYLGGRLAHVHANVLGWGGITLVATLVFFGPSMARTRIEPGADARAARALRVGATALTVAVLLLLATGVGGPAAIGLRAGAGAALAVFAATTTLVSLPVVRAVARAPRATAPQPLVMAVGLWLPPVVFADAVVVATGQWRWLDTVGVLALVGVLAQAILATLVYLAPMLRGRSGPAREAIRARLEVGARTRAVLFQLGVLAAVGAVAGVAETVPLGSVALILLAAVVVPTVLAGAWPPPAADPAR